MGEFDLIRWIRERTGATNRVTIGIGDDCAGLRIRDGFELLATTDMLMEGRHFILDDATPEEVGNKALGVNLSDIAAMAGYPLAALVSVALPRDNAAAVAKGLHKGMNPLAERFGVQLIGGDTNVWDGPLVISITLLGEVESGRAVRRSGAKPGDAIFVTGPLGGSRLWRHLDPQPRVREALALRQDFAIHAMIDLSDGLSSDLGHILDESGGLGATLDEVAIPIHADAHLMSRKDGVSPLLHALHDGEDFELCLAVSPEVADRLTETSIAGVALHRIGTVTKEPTMRMCDLAGNLIPIERTGFDHLRAP